MEEYEIHALLEAKNANARLKKKNIFEELGVRRV